jgi:threonine aldolase
MPRYFFDYYEDGEVFVDAEGTVLAGVAEAGLEAEDIAPEIARDHLEAKPSGGVIEVRARDEAGQVVCAKSIGIRVDGARMDEAFAQSGIRRARTRSRISPDN